MIWVYEVARGIDRNGQPTCWTEVVNGVKPMPSEAVKNLRYVALYNPPEK